MCAKVNHSGGLCGKPDLSGYGLTERQIKDLSLPLLQAAARPPPCLCCGVPMRVVEDSLSLSFQQLGMYELVCDTPGC